MKRKSALSLILLITLVLTFIPTILAANSESEGFYFYISLSDEDFVFPENTFSSGNIGTELVIFDLNRPVEQKERGFPRYEKTAQPSTNTVPFIPGTNGDWTVPINYAGGTLYMRVEVFNQPEPQTMRLQFCVWQDDLQGNRLGLETCTSQANVSGQTGTIVTWSSTINSMWKKNKIPLDWQRQRDRYGVAIKNSKGEPVSNYAGWNWYGEDPLKWYPLNMRFTVVAVPQGASFSGWENYIQTTGIGEQETKKTGGFLENFPNPFQTGTHIEFFLATPEKVKLSVFDIHGRVVKNLIDKRLEAGNHNSYFDATGINPGIYFCRLVIGEYTETRKIVLSRM